MLRLAHRILSQEVGFYDRGELHLNENEKYRIAIVKELLADSSTRILVADNVADYFYSFPDGKQWDFGKDIPSIAPPFEKFFIEWQSQVGREGCPYQTEGVFFHACDSKDWMKLCELYRIPTKRMVLSDNEHAESRWFVMCSLFGSRNGVPESHAQGLMVYVKGDGDLGTIAIHANMSLPEPYRSSPEFAFAAATPAFLAISFTHCKNVITTDATATDGPPAKWLRRMKQPALRYSTINIEPMKQVLRTEGQSETTGLKKALHICRGHFRTYNEAGPGLFGRGQHGTFWVPMHRRGSKDHGEVVATYNVKAPS